MASDRTVRAGAQSGRHRKRMLAVRAMAGETAWLDGRLRWHEDRLVWEDAQGLMAPDANDLALAQRRLNQIAGYPRAARRALGDADTWLERRQARLELAKHLHALRAPDLLALVRPVHLRNPQGLRRLTTLLAAEALCVGLLPASPAHGLLAAGAAAEPPLHALLADESVPVQGRALAALILGALLAGGAVAANAPPLSDPLLARAYAWGRNAGLPPDPGLVLTLLCATDGTDLARRIAQALSSTSPFRLSPDLLRELLADGTLPADVVALAEGAAALATLAEHMLQRRGAALPSLQRQRRVIAERLLSERRAAIADLADALRAIVRAAPDPAIYPLVATFAQGMLALAPLGPALAALITQPLQAALELPPRLIRPCLELLPILPSRAYDLPHKAQMTPVEHTAWLSAFNSRWLEPIIPLFQATGDPAAAREALELDLDPVLFAGPGSEPGMPRTLLALVRDFDLGALSWLAHNLSSALATLGDARSVRTLLVPLTNTLLPFSLGHRQHMLDVLLSALPNGRRGMRDALARLLPFMPTLARFAEADTSEWCICEPTMIAALALDRAVPDQAAAWMDWLLSELRARPEREWKQVQSVRVGAPLAVALADGELPLFQAIVRAAEAHGFDQSEELVTSGRDLVARRPALRRLIALAFPQQPRRCATLLARLGLIARLGAAAAAPLDAFHSEEVALPPAWAEPLALAPSLWFDATRYAQARLLLGTPADVPAGVRRALDLPRKLAGELAYLRTALERDPGRSDLAARANSLEQRLQDGDAVLAAARREAADRLRQLALDAELAAAEHLVLLCFRQRLAQLAISLPPDMPLDDDLFNGIQLVHDIRWNRRLLLRLLRSHTAGETGWRENHPANAAFLHGLAERGVDAESWLGEHPHSYPLPGIPGGRVRLRLERDPLKILQMGSLFDTCLSFGQVNAFSAVTNACELNKRVIYASDGDGRIVGRQLVASNENGALVGFRIYRNLPDPQLAAPLQAIFRRYAHDFAQRCHMLLADDGAVPTLFAEHWYDDGVVPWEAEPAEDQAQNHRHSAHHS